MRFFDVQCTCGKPSKQADYRPVADCGSLSSEMARAGIQRAIVCFEDQMTLPPDQANAYADQAVAPYESLWSVWTLSPSATCELPSPQEAARLMKGRRVAGWKPCPAAYHYPAHPLFLADWYETAERLKIPVFLSTADGFTWGDILAVLERYPNLTTVLSHTDCWPVDRLIWPVIAAFPNTHLETSLLIEPDGFESFVKKFGPTRLVFGTGFPKMYQGAAMLALRNADLSETDKQAIASGNMERLLEGMNHD